LTYDYLRWSYAPRIPIPSTKIRALLNHSKARNEDQLRFYLPDPALIQSIKSPPHTYANEIEEWLHETVQLRLHPLASGLHYPTLANPKRH